MAFVFSLANLLVFLQLWLLLGCSFIAYGSRNLQGQYQPGATPHPPNHPTVSLSSPSEPPVKQRAPSYLFPRRKVVVYGVVNCLYCPSNLFPRVELEPLPGAVVKLQCNNTKYTWEEQTTSGKGGNIVFMPGREKLSTFGAHMCRVFLVSSNDNRCTVPSVGDGGATLNPSTTYNMSFGVFNVGPLTFAYPKDCISKTRN